MELNNYRDSIEFIGTLIDTVDTYILNHDTDDGVTEEGYDHLAAELISTLEQWNINLNSSHKKEIAYRLWHEFGDVPMNLDTECIEEEWHGFPVGTHREDIWEWFENTLGVSVGADLMYN